MAATTRGGAHRKGLGLAPSERRWVNFVRSELRLTQDARIAKRTVDRLAGLYHMDDAVLQDAHRIRAALGSGLGGAAGVAVAAPPVGAVHYLGALGAGGAAAAGALLASGLHCAVCSPFTGKERFFSGKIDFQVPCGYKPNDPDDEAFEFMWYPFTGATDSAGYLDWATIEQDIDASRWGGGTADGMYPGWQSKGGRNWVFTQWVLQLLYTYRSLIPGKWPTNEVMTAYRGRPGGLGTSPVFSSGPIVVAPAELERFCKEAPAALADLMENNCDILRVWAYGTDGCPLDGDEQLVESRDPATCERTYELWHGLPEGANIPYRGQCCPAQICSSYLGAGARTADYFLYWGNRAYWTAMTGRADDLADAFRLLYGAQLCGRVSLGAAMVPARTLLHEFIHETLSEGHCDTACCPQGLAAIFWARVRAYLGVPEVWAGEPGKVDTSFTDAETPYSSTCHTDNGEDWEIVFRWLDPGRSGDSSAYEIDSVSWAPSCTP